MACHCCQNMFHNVFDRLAFPAFNDVIRDIGKKLVKVHASQCLRYLFYGEGVSSEWLPLKTIVCQCVNMFPQCGRSRRRQFDDGGS